ncbi:hypothetical protein [Nocardia noduli]|uniref:ATP dependent DNA ligase n=1 Tax=Nocardia noduli TaxID=2815722 RepID=UPI0034D57AF5
MVQIGHCRYRLHNDARRDLQSRLNEHATLTSPFSAQADCGSAAAHWARPVLVVAVEYREYTDAGQRHPSPTSRGIVHYRQWCWRELVTHHLLPHGPQYAN